jgi:hypothetical protein
MEYGSIEKEYIKPSANTPSSSTPMLIEIEMLFQRSPFSGS